MTIYLDIFFLKNMIFNFLLIYLTSLIIRKKIKIYKVIIGACVGGAYAILALYYPNMFNSILLKIIIGMIMLVISFGIKEVTIMVSTFFVLAYSLAGVIASILNINSQILMLFFAISTGVIFYFYETKKKFNEFYEMDVQILKDEINIMAKLDTGNELRDSLFGDAVIVVSERKLKNKLDEDLMKILRNEKFEIPEKYKNRIKLISFKTIAEEGIKIGVKLDKVIIYTGNKQIESNAIMILSERNFRDYDALIGKSLLMGGYEYENISFNEY